MADVKPADVKPAYVQNIHIVVQTVFKSVQKFLWLDWLRSFGEEVVWNSSSINLHWR